jgi:hypothetical protein
MKDYNDFLKNDNLVRFNKIGSKSIIIFRILEFLFDRSFKTKCVLNKSNTEFYTYTNIDNTDLKLVIPKVGYDIYIRTNQEKDANLLVISYLNGTDTIDIIEYLGDDTYIIDDKVIVKERIPNTYPIEYKNERTNDILKYIGIEHIEKPKNEIKYEGDCYSKIKLLPDCKYRLYKFEKSVKV